MTADTPAKKEEAGLSRAAVMQILKAAGMPLADITECERLAALSEAELRPNAAWNWY